MDPTGPGQREWGPICLTCIYKPPNVPGLEGTKQQSVIITVDYNGSKGMSYSSGPDGLKTHCEREKKNPVLWGFGTNITEPFLIIL